MEYAERGKEKWKYLPLLERVEQGKVIKPC